MGLIDSEFESASNFLGPILKPSKPTSDTTEISVTRLLRPRCERVQPGLTDQAIVSLQALHFLKQIDTSLRDLAVTSHEIDETFQTPRRRRVLNTLVDIVSIEGIRPYLQPGVGLPITQRLQTSFGQWQLSSNQSISAVEWDDGAWQIYRDIASLRSGSLLSHLIDDRIMVDLLAFMLQGKHSSEVQSADIDWALSRLVESMETSKIMPLVASLLHSGAPKWIQSAASTILAKAPLRPNGVHDTINFIAASQQRRISTSYTDVNTTPNGPVLSNDVLEQAAQVICAVPKAVQPDTWFKGVGVQILTMLSSNDKDEQKAASYISGAVLSRRNVGAPGTAGWNWLSVPLVGNVNPDLRDVFEKVWPTVQKALNVTDPIGWSTSCLARLLLLHPNPGLVKRIGSRVFTNLWSIACLTRTSEANSQLQQDSIRIIQRFVALSDHKVIEKLIERFLANGTDRWQYAFANGIIELTTPDRASDDDFSSSSMILKLETNMSVLMDVIKGLSEDDLCDVFVSVLGLWATCETAVPIQTVLASDTDDSRKLVLTKAAYTLLDNHTSIIAKNPTKMLPVIASLLESFVVEQETKIEQNANANLESLAHITKDHGLTSQDDGDHSTLANLGLGLLAVVLMEDRRYVPKANFSESFNRLTKILTRLVGLPKLPEVLSLPAQAALTQLNTVARSKDASSIDQGSKTSRLDDNSTGTEFQDALRSISSPMPPIRAEGLHVLNRMIYNSSPAALGPGTMSILLSLLQEEDEFTYLNAIKSIALLVSRQPNSASAQLVDAYIDQHELSSLEVRLRLGEAIGKIVIDLSSNISPAAASKIAHGMIFVASRRGQREREFEGRRQAAKQKERERKRAEREWGGEIPELPDEIRDEVTPADEAAANIIEKWAGSGRGEDLRIRVSSLSILGTLLSQAMAKLDEATVEEIVSLCILTIKHEIGESSAIVRRAAILVFQAMVVGSRDPRVEGQPSVSLTDTQSFEIVQSLQMVEESDNDGIARGHAGEVLRAIQNSQADAFEIRLRGEGIKTDLGDKLRGLVVEPDTSQRPRPSIQEID